jgi:chromosome segregation ATPase
VSILTKEHSEEIRAQSARHPEFEAGTAYVRTKICCQALMEAGHGIPSWIVIRDIIGKGSSSDISRATKDFRQDHGARLRAQTDPLSTIPPRLRGMLEQIWAAAAEDAQGLFDEQTQSMTQAIEAAEQDAAKAKFQANHEAEQALRLSDQLAKAESRAQDFAARLAAEQATLTRARELFQQQLDELAGQRASLQSALEGATSEVAKAIESLDGERRFAMLSIETARREARELAATEVASIRSQAGAEIAGLRADLDRERSRADAAGTDARNARERLTQTQDRLLDVERKLAAQTAIATHQQAAERLSIRRVSRKNGERK